MDRLADKRVAIIGTGATAVQCVPHLARAAGELYVFQRTPSSVDVRDNRPTDPDWFAEIATPGWQQRWLENFAANQSGALPGEDLVQDGWTDLARRVRERILTLAPEDFTPEKMMEAFEDSDFEKMEEIRARVDSVVDDRDTAQKLKAWYRQLCKRPCFHDEYLDAYNAPNTHLVDTDGQGVERITETGVVVAGVEYPVDCIVYASGFEVGTDPTSRAGLRPRRPGRAAPLRALGLRHAVAARRPRPRLPQHVPGPAGPGRQPHLQRAPQPQRRRRHDRRHRAPRTRRGRGRGRGHRGGRGRLDGAAGDGDDRHPRQPRVHPGLLQQRGPARVGWELLRGYPLGATAYFAYIDAWRRSGTFEGLEIRSPA